MKIINLSDINRVKETPEQTAALKKELEIEINMILNGIHCNAFDEDPPTEEEKTLDLNPYKKFINANINVGQMLASIYRGVGCKDNLLLGSKDVPIVIDTSLLDALQNRDNEVRNDNI